MFDFTRYLDVSNLLANHPTDEACVRSGVSRAYYAAFHAVKTHLVNLDGSRFSLNGNTWSHHAIWKNFSSSDEPVEWQEIGLAGLALLTLRKSADYNVPPDSFGTVTSAVADSALIIEKTRQIHVLPSRQFRTDARRSFPNNRN